MTLIRDISNHVRSLGQKLSASNIHNLGQKAMNTAHVIGRKASNTLSKIEEIGKKAIPIVSTAASMHVKMLIVLEKCLTNFFFIFFCTILKHVDRFT